MLVRTRCNISLVLFMIITICSISSPICNVDGFTYLVRGFGCTESPQNDTVEDYDTLSA
jgi:hypothetical protein